MALLSQEKKEADDYKAPDSCAGCHDELVTSFARNRHANVKQSCDACHANAKAHSESADPADVKNPAKLSGLAADKSCLSCHQNQSTQLGRIRGGHARSAVNCTTCHSVHTAKKKPDDCGQCHSGTVAEFQRPYRHNIQNGAVKCTDCHNPHGRTLSSHLSATSANEPGCFKCHGNMRGPFVFEHAAVRQEGCQGCHEPHGSANPRMLNRAQVHLQCLECHTSINTGTGSAAASNLPGGTPPAFHNLRDPRIRNCTTCHIKIHGSHVNRALLR
jgi:DmsE family decaheme c-type cytochrome